jgi:hypothetical protein
MNNWRLWGGSAATTAMLATKRTFTWHTLAAPCGQLSMNSTFSCDVAYAVSAHRTRRATAAQATEEGEGFNPWMAMASSA